MKILSLLALAMLACTAPIAPRAPIPTRTIRVAIEDGSDMTGWFSSHRVAIARVWPRLDATGYRWIVDEHNPELFVRTFDAHGCSRSAGEYLLGSRVVTIDPACVHSDEELIYAVMHEALHWWTWREFRWAGHLCKHARDVADCHPSVHGVGVLSPVLGEELDDFGVEISSASANLSSDDLRLLRALRIAR